MPEPAEKEPVVFEGSPTGRRAEFDWLMNRENPESTYQQAIEDIVADAQAMERTLKSIDAMPQAVDATEEKLRKEHQKKAHDDLIRLRDKYEDLVNSLPPDHELRSKAAPMEQAAAEIFNSMLRKSAGQLEEGAIVNVGSDRDLNGEPGTQAPGQNREKARVLDKEKYEQRVWAILQDVVQIGEMLNFKGNDTKVRETMLRELLRLEEVLRDLDVSAQYPDSQIRRDAERIIDELGKRWQELVPPEKPSPPSVPRPRTPKGSVFAAWMPRVPRPAYAARPDMRVMLAAVSALPPLAVPAPAPGRAKPKVPVLPKDWDSLDEAARVAALETFLGDFIAEYSRIMGEHRAALQAIISGVKERKLKALRAKLDVSE
ncbi:MAG TPA: hypothetical protein VD862_00465 [Candidatus Paceibacterota bacterium]|nr:hypothetical protein [Candidatus Paceibacterota bacterium]